MAVYVVGRKNNIEVWMILLNKKSVSKSEKKRFYSKVEPSTAIPF